jgi:hypothetical protein
MDCIKTGERKYEDVTKGMMVDAVAVGAKSGTIVSGYSKLSNIKEKLVATSGKEKDKEKLTDIYMPQDGNLNRRKGGLGGVSSPHDQEPSGKRDVNSYRIPLALCTESSQDKLDF